MDKNLKVSVTVMLSFLLIAGLALYWMLCEQIIKSVGYEQTQFIATEIMFFGSIIILLQMIALYKSKK